MEFAHRNIIRQGISVVCTIKFEYKNIFHAGLFGKDYFLPLIFPFSFLTLQTFILLKPSLFQQTHKFDM